MRWGSIEKADQHRLTALQAKNIYKKNRKKHLLLSSSDCFRATKFDKVSFIRNGAMA